VFFLCYFQIWPHTFEERLSVNSCYSEWLSKRKKKKNIYIYKCIISAYACGDSHKFQFKQREENRQLQILTHFEISAQLNSDRPALGTGSSAPARARSSRLNLVSLSELCRARGKKDRRANCPQANPSHGSLQKRICIPDAAMEIFPAWEGAKKKY